MHEIHNNMLWIGNAFDIREPRAVFDAGIVAIIDVAYEERPAISPRQLIYCRFPLNDGGGNCPNVLRITLQMAVKFLESEVPTLIACSAGMSRSPMIAAFALGHFLLRDPNEVIRRIAKTKSLEINRELWLDLSRVKI